MREYNVIRMKFGKSYNFIYIFSVTFWAGETETSCFNILRCVITTTVCTLQSNKMEFYSRLLMWKKTEEQNRLNSLLVWVINHRIEWIMRCVSYTLKQSLQNISTILFSCDFGTGKFCAWVSRYSHSFVISIILVWHVGQT